MILSEQSARVSCPALLVSLAFALGLAALAVAAHNVERPLRSVEAHCEPVSELQHVIWHHQQSAAVEIDSLIGLVRLFRTIADELAGTAEDGVASPPERPVGIDAAQPACGGGARPRAERVGVVGSHG